MNMKTEMKPKMKMKTDSGAKMNLRVTLFAMAMPIALRTFGGLLDIRQEARRIGQ